MVSNETEIKSTIDLLSNTENIIWLMEHTILQIAQLVVTLYFFIRILMMAKMQNQRLDKFTIATMIIITFSIIIQTIAFSFNDIMGLIYFFSRQSHLNEPAYDPTRKEWPYSYWAWYHDNFYKMREISSDVHKAGLHLRNIAIIINISRWFIIINEKECLRHYSETG
jgi:hypothetical protein